MARRQRTPGVIPVPIEKESWLNAYWRPMAAVVYLIICICDFIAFPLIFGMRTETAQELALAIKNLDPQVAAVIAAPHPQWTPLTLQGNGLFHIAFGAILGVAAWTRGVERIEGVRNQAYNSWDQQTQSWNQQYQQPYSPYQQPYQYQQPYMMGATAPGQQPIAQQPVAQPVPQQPVPQQPVPQQPVPQPNSGGAVNPPDVQVDNPDL